MSHQRASLLLGLLLLISLQVNSLQFNEKGEFTIVQLTDTHYCVNEKADQRTQDLHRKIFEQVNPDFVAISGDGITGGPTYHTPGGFEKCWERMLEPMLEAQIPYGYILGNHDGEGDLDRFQIAKLDQTHPMSVRKESEGIPGTLNFNVPIYSSKDGKKLAANIWMLDTGYVGCNGLDNSWGCLEDYQLEWYDKQSKKLRKQHGKDVHHLAFLHIPIPEFRELYNNGEVYGDWKYGIGCPMVNTGFFNRLKKNGDISGIFFGHDHFNTMGGFYKGVELVYGQNSGYSTASPTKGARIIKLKENYTPDGKLYVTREHYILRDNGEIVKPSPKRREGPKIDSCWFPPGPDSKLMMKLKKLFYDTKNMMRKH